MKIFIPALIAVFFFIGCDKKTSTTNQAEIDEIAIPVPQDSAALDDDNEFDPKKRKPNSVTKSKLKKLSKDFIKSYSVDTVK